MAEAWFVTHGEKETGGDPGMTEKGFDEVKALRDRLPEEPDMVICGTGQRHQDVAEALGLTPDRYTSVIGGPDSMERREGGVKVIVLANGREVDPAPDKYTSLADLAVAMEELVTSLPDGKKVVFCVGRPSMMMLGESDAKSASVYEIVTDKGEIASIEEVIATGEAEEGTV